MVRHLYVHIPFCPKICPYCSFYKEASDRNKTAAFLDALLREAEIHAQDLRPHTIFFGGGTPTALSTPQLDTLLSGLHRILDLSEVQEWTFEMNPATVSLEKAQLLLSHGVNRISMGVQSWDNALLKTLGRVHDAKQAERSYHVLREAGVTNVNLDLIFGVPGQTLEQWEHTLEKTLSLQPDHISAYCLTYEEDTEYFQRMLRGEFRENEEFDASLFETTMNRLEGAEYMQYEISNYSRPGRECRHNLAYWLGADYLGFGPSAFATVGERRWQNIADTSEYIRRIGTLGQAAEFQETLDPETRRRELAAFSLRTNQGLLPSEAEKRHLVPLLQEGLLTESDGVFRLTRQGRLVADAVAASVL